MPHHPRTEQLFSDWARQGKAEGMERGHSPRALQALKRIPLRPGQRLLDLGCGNGWATRWLRQRAGVGGSAIGVDVSEPMLQLARAASEGIEGLSYLRVAFDELPLPDASIDHAFSMEALYYSPALAPALESVARVLRPGGSLTVCVDYFEENPHSHGWPEQLGVSMILLSTQGWIQALESAGLVVEETTRCLDSRPVQADLPPEERAAEEAFRQEIGTLALRARRA